MFKKLSSLVVMTALLSTASTHAHYPTTEAEKLYDRGTQLAAGFHRTISNPRSQEAKWWGDFEKSGKGILIYVEDLATKDSEAAMWFLVTGGKYGFSSRKATQDEERLILSAMQKVAKSFASSENKREGHEKWIGMDTAHQAGHVHLNMIYNQIDDLKKANQELFARVGALEAKNGILEGEIKGLKVMNSSLEERLLGVQNDLKEERKQREAERESMKRESAENLAEVKRESAENLAEVKRESAALFKSNQLLMAESKEQTRNFIVEMANQREQTNMVIKELYNQHESFLALHREEQKAFQHQLMILAGSNTQITTLFGDYTKVCDERLEKLLQFTQQEAQKREEALLARIAQFEQAAREREQGYINVN